jgi:hypothetical protein
VSEQQPLPHGGKRRRAIVRRGLIDGRAGDQKSDQKSDWRSGGGRRALGSSGSLSEREALSREIECHAIDPGLVLSLPLVQVSPDTHAQARALSGWRCEPATHTRSRELE